MSPPEEPSPRRAASSSWRENPRENHRAEGSAVLPSKGTRRTLTSPDARSSIIKSESSRLVRNASGRPLRPSWRENTQENHRENHRENHPTEGGATVPPEGTRRTLTSPEARASLVTSESRLLRNTSGRLLRSSSRESSRENSGEIGEHNVAAHRLQLKNCQPHTVSASCSSSATPASSFIVMVTGHIESIESYDVNDRVYCRYSFSYGPDWEVVHGVTMGVSQIGRRGVPRPRDGGDAIVWNFPLDVAWTSTGPHGWPRLALSVYGFDFWGRDVPVGYASLLLPLGPGRHTRYLKIFRPVSGSRVVQFVNWLMGTTPEYYDSKMVTRGEGRSVTRVVGADRTVKVNLMVTLKDFAAFGFVS